MKTQQMAMPAEMAAQGPNPEEMAIYDRMRQEISPQEFSNEMLAGASQVDPQAVAEFTQELQGLDMPPEVLDALNDVVDEILASPERYDELRAQYMEQGLPEDILPEQFDPQFFAALNMAIDQMIAAPTGVQAFAAGGIAELKPIAKAIASYGRNGDTLLAHITPAEARMLRRRGGSGTTNPKTGLPEFFLKKLFKGIGKALKSVGRAVKKFANSTVGRIITTVALGFFLGPAAASFLGASSAAGVAAISGFVGSAGSTLLGGGSLKDALKAGAIGGLTAGAGAGIMGGADAFASGSASTAGLTPGQALSGQVDKFTNAVTPGAPVVNAPAALPGLSPSGAAPLPVDNIDVGGGQNFALQGPATSAAPLPVDNIDIGGGQNFALQGPATSAAPAAIPGASAPDATQFQGSLAKAAPAESGMLDRAKDFYSKNISPSGIQEAGRETAMSKTLAQFPGATPEQVMNAPASSVLGKAYQSAMPGMLSTYGPMAAVGLGTMAAFGGFNTKPVEGGDITKSLMKPVTQRIREDGTQRQMYSQGLPGVVYDEYGEPIFGKSTRLPTYDVPDYNSGGFGLPDQGIMRLPTAYTSPAGSMGSRRVEQPYNNADMYSNIMPRRYSIGGPVIGDITNFRGSYGSAEPVKNYGGVAGNRQYSTEVFGTPAQQQRAARAQVALAKAQRRAAGSGQMYANINAGLSALAPETSPTDGGDTGFGARNRATQLANLQQTYGPMLERQRNAMEQQSIALSPPQPIATMPVIRPDNGTIRHYGIDRYGRGFGEGFGSAPPKSMNMGGIAGLAEGGYPRRNGQISGPGTEKSDSIPAMLSDGEFVMTAKAVRGAGKGSRRAGAKQMYKLMHQLEKNAERG